jgi:DNA-binding response OmpR family regulator
MLHNSKRILVVEDEWLIGEYVADHLAETGYAVEGPAPNVGTALRILEQTQIDGAVLDITLGREKSFPIAERLLALNIPFVFLSGYVETDLPQMFSEVPLLTKPVGLSNLTTAIDRFW